MDISDRINGLDLFSGIGGISLALSPWVRPIAYCERDTYCQSVLLSNMASARLDTAPIWSDVKTLNSKWFQERETEIDIIFGGFPCQDISFAGTGAGLEGERSGLFFEVIRLCRDLRPRFAFLENVPAITTRGGIRVIKEFTELGYDCRWTIVSAAELGAPHLRKRWFLLAHSNGESVRIEQRRIIGTRGERKAEPGNNGTKESLANTNGEGLSGSWNRGKPRQAYSERASEGIERDGWWETEPDVGRVVNGLPHRVDRIKGLGNSVVPVQAREAFMRLMGLQESGDQ